MILKDLEKSCRDVSRFGEVLRRYFALEVTVSSTSFRYPTQVRSFSVVEMSEATRCYFQKLSYARYVNESADTWKHASFFVELRLVCYGDAFLGCSILKEEVCA